MISVLIVDDEFLIRQLIISSVNWDEMNIKIIGEASDGISALDMVERFRPDLIILDINIPIKNGIEISQIVLEKYPDSKIIMVTGYDNFSYIQQSMRAGVLDYIVKPIDSVELTHSVQKARQHILQNQIYQKNFYLNKSAEKYQAMICTNELDIIKLMEQSLFAKSCISIVLELDGYQSQVNKSLYISTGIEHIITACDLFFYNQGLKALFFVAKTQIILSFAPSNIHENSLSFIQALQKYLINKLESSVSIGIGAIVPPYQLLDSITNARKALEQKFFEGYGKIFSINDCNHIFPNCTNQLYDYSTILHPLRNLEHDVVINGINNLYKQIIYNKFSKDYTFLITAELISIAIKFLVENNLDTEGVFSNRDHVLCHMQKYETIWDLERWITNLFYNIIMFAGSQKASKTSYIVSQACNYIHENYSNSNLSLNLLATQLFINPSYLSKVFKQITLVSVSEYIIETRMRKAKELFDLYSTVKISEISIQVGYSDPFYFSKSFKKHNGISPSKYLSNRLGD